MVRDFNAPKRQTSTFSGTVFWRQFGVLHRSGGPAVIYRDGGEEWIKYGKFHREDGPAVITEDGRKYWYVNGEPIYTFEEYQRCTGCADEIMSFLKLKHGIITPSGEGFVGYIHSGNPYHD